MRMVGWELCWAFAAAKRVVEMMLEGSPAELLAVERLAGR